MSSVRVCGEAGKNSAITLVVLATYQLEAAFDYLGRAANSAGVLLRIIFATSVRR
jgi:hypothetical protein